MQSLNNDNDEGEDEKENENENENCTNIWNVRWSHCGKARNNNNNDRLYGAGGGVGDWDGYRDGYEWPALLLK